MTTRKTLILMLALFSAAAFAQQSGGNRQMRQQMPQMAQMQQMQGRMQTMQSQMARIHETSDPAERQRLMQEHMENLHQGMMMMGQMMQGGTTGSSMPQCQADDTQCRVDQMQMQQQMMSQQMGMMLQMMEQMMQRQELSGDGAANEGH